MANKNYGNEDGVWRTIGGRRVFIKNGQSMADAMKESGKFNKKEKKQESISDQYEVYEDKNGYRGKGKELLKFIEAEEKDSGVEVSQKIKDQLKENADRDVVFDNNNEKLTIVGGKENEKGLTEEGKRIARGDFKNKEEKDMWEKAGQETKKLLDDDYDYKLYKKAMTNPDSIDPMTENSTDWEALDKKYKDRYNREREEELANYKRSMAEYWERKAKNLPEGADWTKQHAQETANRLRADIEAKENNQFKPRAVGAKTFEEHGVAFKDNATNERFSDYLRDKYGTDDLDIITTGSERTPKTLRDEFNNKELKEYQNKWLNDEDYLRENNPNAHLNKMVEKSKANNYAEEKDEEKRIKNVYMMDRVLRSMNNEDALDDMWLMNGVADGDSDNGFDKFKEYSEKFGEKGYWYTDDEEYNDLVKMYQRRVKKYAKDGVITDNKEIIDFVKNDIDSFPVYGKSGYEVTDAKDGKKYASMKSYLASKENNVSQSIRNEAYKKYMKEHPGSKMTLEEFLKR